MNTTRTPTTSTATVAPATHDTAAGSGDHRPDRAAPARVTGAPACPTCGGKMWDNRATKRNPKAPDFKCRDRACDGVIWPGKHRVAVPILTPRTRLPDATTAPQRPLPRSPLDALVSAPAAAPPNASRGATLRARYLDATDFVLSTVRPKYDAAGLPLGDATAAAIVATLFVQSCSRGPNATTTAAAAAPTTRGREGA